MRLVTGHHVTLTELETIMSLDDVVDMNLILEAEARAEHSARKRNEK